MFEKFKDLAKLKQMHDAMKQHQANGESNGVTITINGNFEVQTVKLNPSLSIADQEKAVLQAFNQAKDQLQKSMAQGLMGMM